MRDDLARGPDPSNRVQPPRVGERCPRCHQRVARGRSTPCMLCAPDLVPIASYVANLMAGRAWCYWAFPGWWTIDHGARYTLSVVVDGELGHFPTGTAGLALALTVATAPDLETANLEARWLNRDRGISDRETDRIVCSSIGAAAGRGERLL